MCGCPRKYHAYPVLPLGQEIRLGRQVLGGWRKEASPFSLPVPEKSHPKGRSFLSPRDPGVIACLGLRCTPCLPSGPALYPRRCLPESRVRSQQPGNPSQGDRAAALPCPRAPSRPVPPVGAARGPRSRLQPPAAPGPHTFPQRSSALLSAALLRSPATLRLLCLLPPQSSAQPHRSNRWGTVATYRRLCGSSPEAALRPVPGRGGTMGGTAGAGGRGGRADLLLYSLPASGLRVRNSFVQPSRSLCPSSCSAQSLLGLCPGSGS